jgi:transposase-like protein
VPRASPPGVDRDARREILGLAIGPSEAATFWLGFLRRLEQRGVQLVISDAQEGLKAVIAQVLKANRQRCRVRFVRNCPAAIAKGQRSIVAVAVRTISARDIAEVAHDPQQVNAMAINRVPVPCVARKTRQHR